MSWASWARSLVMSQRGLSGRKLDSRQPSVSGLGAARGGGAGPDSTYKTKQICNMEGQIWRSEGILHAQSFLILLVPKQMAAAMIWPTK